MLIAIMSGMIAFLAMARTNDQTPAEKLNAEGNDLGRARKFSEAIKRYSRAIELDPTYDEPYYNRGKAKLNLNDYRGAVADFNLALRLTPKSADTYNNRGIARRKLGDIKGAIEDYTTALHLDPTLYRVHLNRGIALFDVDNIAAACEDFRKALQHGIPEAAEALRQVGCS